MCDPTMLLSIVGGLASKRSKTSAPAVATAVAPDAAEETGADVVLGGNLDDDEKKKKAVKRSSKVSDTSGTGLKSNASGSGISIL